MSELAATLAGEPWCLTPEQAGRLTLGQVSELFFAARDKDGRLIPFRDPDAPQPPSQRQRFIDHWRKWGLSRDRAEALWREEQAKRRVKRKDKNSRKHKRAAKSR